MNTSFTEIGQALRAHQKFAVLSHVRPDGDALGSQIAMALSLQHLGKEVRVWNENGMLAGYVYVDIAGRDLGGYVEEQVQPSFAEVLGRVGRDVGGLGHLDAAALRRREDLDLAQLGT